MPEVRVSTEKELEASLHGEHQLTVINPDYEPDIFHGYNINYCFNETPAKGDGKFFQLKHIFHPYEGRYVFEGYEVYHALLDKLKKRNHSVAFILSTENAALLRLCQCFIGAASNLPGIEQSMNKSGTSGQTASNAAAVHLPIPYIIGKKKESDTWMPVWSYFWEVKIKSLDSILKDIFCSKFSKFSKDFRYSKEGLSWLQSLIGNIMPLITSGAKRRLYCFDPKNKQCQCRQSIEGPHEMLDLTLIVEKIEQLAIDALKGLKPFQIVKADGKFIPSPHNLDNNAICDFLGVYNAEYGSELICQMLFDDYHSNLTIWNDENPYMDAFGCLAEPTDVAIDKRIDSKDSDGDFCHDGMGNLYSFAYKIGEENRNGMIVVCPEGKDNLITKLFGVQPNKNSDAFISPGSAEESGNKSSMGSKPSGVIEPPRVPQTSTADIPPEINQDKVTADYDAVSSTQSYSAVGAPTPDKENSQAQVIDVDFESCKGKKVKYKLNGIEHETTLKVAPLHFLAFNAGYKGKYIFAYNQKTGVWLIKDGVNDKDLSPLFKNDNKTFIKNIAGAITDMFIPFLPSGKKESKDNVNLINKCHGLLYKPGIRYPKIEDDEALKTILDKEKDRLVNKKDQLPKEVSRLENETDKRLTLAKEKLKMAMVKLRDNINFKITLSNTFITGVQELPEYKASNVPSTENQYKAIIDFIIDAYPPE